jgi:AraC family transcriptional regulator, melibiose operon regulatory protein
MTVDSKAFASGNISERRFYRRSKAFGRFGMRIFAPKIMEHPHWHGHIEANFIRNGRLNYIMDGKLITVEPDQLVLFWANVPHQLIEIEPVGSAEPELCNIYLPLDVFLVMPHLAELQIALLNGGMVLCPTSLCSHWHLLSWYEDYRSGDAERLDILKMELNALFRRMSVSGLNFLRAPGLHKALANTLSSQHIHHVVAMIRHVLDNLANPMRNADVTAVTGLHTNYALNIFTKAMNIPLRQFVLRMRLLRARGMLLESNLAITSVAVESGFGSTSQFYAQFSAAYGTSPNQLRQKYLDLLSA